MRRDVRPMVVRVVLTAILVAAALAGYALTSYLRTRPATARPHVATPPALAAAVATPAAPVPSSTAALPSAAGVARALSGVIGNPQLGGRLLAHVVDAATGTVLYDRSGAIPAAPASTAKLLTAAAVLDVYQPTERFTTAVVAGSAPGTVVVVGGGDPTLTGAAKGQRAAYPGSARVTSLAAQLRHAHVSVRRIVVDDSLFSGPAVSPNWALADAPSDYAAPITALMVDGGRASPGDAVRSGTPELAAGAALAGALGNSSIAVSTGHAPPGATSLAAVRSAPLSVLVTQMLEQSDNVIAEVLGRQVAIAEHRPGSFTGATSAIRSVLLGLNVQVGGGLHDCSGLAASDRVSPAVLTAVLQLIAGHGAPKSAASLRLVVSALPVAGWSGTLARRYVSGVAAAAAGRVRAKTGTLTGVSSIAGYVHDRSGRLLVFALDADRAADTLAAEAGLDQVASALAGCGCG